MTLQLSDLTVSSHHVCYFDRKAEVLRARVALATTNDELGDSHTRAYRFAIKQFGPDADVGDLKVGMLAYLTDWARRKKQGRLDECVSRFLLRCAAHLLQGTYDSDMAPRTTAHITHTLS